MKRVQGRQGDVASGEPAGRTAFEARSARPPYHPDNGLTDDGIDIVAVVAAIVVMTLIALAC